MVVFRLDKQKHYSHDELISLGLKESNLPYNNFKVYKKQSLFYLFKISGIDSLIFDSTNY